MSIDHVENLVSVNEINRAIENFIGKHPQNVSVWIDGKTATIQISNIGLRDQIFYRLAYLVENTTIEDKLTVFGMPAKCVIANERIARFVCTLNELVTFVESQDTTSEPLTSSNIKKFSNRLSTSHAFKRAEIIVNQVVNDDDTDESSKIKVYIVSNPQAKTDYDSGRGTYYVSWEVIGIMDIDAGTTWEDEAFRERLRNLKSSSGVNSDKGEYGALNIAFESGHNNSVVENGKLVGMLTEFTFDSSIKVGDIIDSRDYQDYDIWKDWGYQADVEYGYQKFNSFCNDSLYPHSENDGPFGKTLIPDGAIITI